MPPSLDACRVACFPIGAEVPVVQGSCGETALAAEPTSCCGVSDNYEAGTATDAAIISKAGPHDLGLERPSWLALAADHGGEKEIGEGQETANRLTQQASSKGGIGMGNFK